MRSQIKRALLVAAALLVLACAPSKPDGSGPLPVTASPTGAPAQAAAQSGVVAVEQVLPGKLTVKVIKHTIAAQSAIPCWSYVSAGLSALGQKEIVFTVKREPGEGDQDYPRDILGFYGLVHDLASEGKIVDSGDVTTFADGSAGIFGDARWKGVLYTDALSLEGVDMTAPHLAGIVVTSGEVRVAHAMGVTRVLSLLGSVNLFYPTTPWLDRKRAEVITPAAATESILAKTRVLHLARATSHQDGEVAAPSAPRPVGEWHAVQAGRPRVELTLPPALTDAETTAISGLGDGDAVAICSGHDPTASAALVWGPGQSEPKAISAPTATGARIAGNFVLFLPDQKESSTVVLEDGFLVRLTADAWKRVRHAFSAKEAASVSGKDGQTVFTLTWLPTTVVTASGGRVEAPGGFATYVPQGPAQPDTAPAHVKMVQVVLLTDQNLIASRTTAEDLAAFVKAASAAVYAHVPAKSPGAGSDLMVECELSRDKPPRIQVAARPSFQDAVAAAIQAGVEKVPSPKIKEGSVRFQILYQLWGGTGKPLGPQ